jgi:subtilase family serine protease
VEDAIMPIIPATGRRRLVALLALLLVPLVSGACTVRVSATATVGTEETAGLGPGAYSPRQVRLAYGVESLVEQGKDGSGQTVVVIDAFGSPTLQQDLDAFSRRFGLPPLTIDIRAPLGAKTFNQADSEMVGWAVETTLDVQTIHALAPGAKIIVLTSPVDETEGVVGLPEFRQLEQYAVDNHLGAVVTQSFGASEISLNDTVGQAELAQWNDLYQQATMQHGVTFVASSGDGGATDYATAADAQRHQLAGTPTTGFPADSPWALTVGGTTLQINGVSVQETAWQESGGGFSRFYAEPSYQEGLPAQVQTQLNNRRGVPDVAASADPRAGLLINFQGRYRVIGGTSAAAPLWAAIIAIGDQMASQPLGFVNPALYKIGTSAKAAQDFRDITVGNNSQSQVGVQGYDAVTGWDPVTGFGAPIADHLLPDLITAR